jgi:ABC-type branched-subunit amino acid transport system ATPase component
MARSGGTVATRKPRARRGSGIEPTAPAEHPLAELVGVDFHYGSLQVLFGVSLQVRRGEILALLGTNGAGKSTILRVISGLSPPTAGRVIVDDIEVTGTRAELMPSMGVVQVPGGKAVFPDLSVIDNLEVGAFLLRRERARQRALIDDVFEMFPRLRDRRRQAAGSLSGGEQQMLAIGKAMLLQPRLLCIDELSLGLAPVVVEGLLKAIREIHERGTTLVIVEQSLNVAVSLCQRAVFLEKGSVRFEGRPAELLERGDLARSVFLGAPA